MQIDRRTMIAGALAALALPKLPSLAQGDSPWILLAGDGSGPLGRWGHNLLADPMNGRLLLIGGRDDAGTVKGDCWSFDLTALTWSELNLSGPSARSGSAAAAAPDSSGFYYFGGASDDEVFDDLWWFDFASTAWKELTISAGAVPSKRLGVRGAVDVQGRFVVSHGHDGDTLLDDTWAFDPSTRTWSDISPEPSLRPMARYDHDLLALPNYGLILLTGGCSDGIGPCPQGDLWAFDSQDQTWSDITPYSGPTPRTGSAIAQSNGTILQVGGLTDLGPESDVWRGYFDGGTIDWQELTLVNHGPLGIYRRYLHDMVSAGNNFYVFGGHGVEGAMSDLWTFSLDRFTESEHSTEPSDQASDQPSDEPVEQEPDQLPEDSDQ